MPFFLESEKDKPFAERARNIVRHKTNPRQHEGVKKQYIQSVKMRGIVEDVRGGLWAVEAERVERNGHMTTGPAQAVTFGSLTESFYAALHEEPENPMLLQSLSKGLEARILSAKTLMSVLKYLVTFHNHFHAGAATSFVELVQMVPDVTKQHSSSSVQADNHMLCKTVEADVCPLFVKVEVALTNFKQAHGITWTCRDYEAQ